MASEIGVQTIQHTNGTDAMTIDSSGRVNQPALPAFFALGTASGYQACATSNTVITEWSTSGTGYFSHGGLTHSSGVVTVPIAGIYEVTGSVLTETDNAEYCILMIYQNSDRIALCQMYNQSAGGQIENTATVHAFANCAAGDEITLRQQGGTTSTRWYNNGTYGTFGVRLVG